MSEAKPQEEKEERADDDGNEEENLRSLLTSSISAAHEFLLRHDTAALSPKISLAIESLLSSSALSLRRLSLPLSHRRRHVTPLIDRLLSSPESPLWLHSLRLSHRSFSLLLRRLPPPLSLSPNSVAAALFRLAHSAPYSSLRRRFSLQSSAEAARAFFSLLKALPESLPPPSPSSSPHCLVIRRLPSGVLVQALVDSSTGKFSDVSAGWPGSLSPDAVLRQTRLFLSFEDSADSSVVDFPTRFVLGDPCFPLLPWLLTPYSGKEDDSTRLAFNEFHAGAMSKVRGAFRGVTKRWTILNGAWKEECAEYVPFVVVACCLLHNFAVECGESLPVKEEGEEEGLSDEDEDFGVYDGERSESGERARDAVAADLARQCSER